MRLFEGPGLGSHWWVETRDELEPFRSQSLASAIESTIAAFQADYSRFLDDSYIGRLNRDGELNNPPSELFDIVTAAESLRIKTQGRFNVGVGVVLENLGYDAQYHLTEQATTRAINESVFRQLSATYIELAAGSRIDLGGIGKGWLIDRLAHELEAAGVGDYYVNGGGDIYAHSLAESFTFALENPFDPSQSVGNISVRRGGIGGSSANRRQWKSATSGQTHHHIIDPATGASHPGPAAVFTYGQSATAADVAATILFLTPAADIRAMAKILKVEYLIVQHDGTFERSPRYPGELNS